MSQERWDIVLRFLHGPLSFQGDVVCRGPIVRIGASPGPGGLSLDGYRGLDNRQAVISAYDGGSVSIAPVGANQVRVAPHENVDWNSIQVLQGPTFLSPGCAIHLGPPGRGCSIAFLEARRLGVWEKGNILSDAAQTQQGIQPSSVKQLDAKGGLPAWFIPAMLLVGLTTAVGVVLSVIKVFAPDVPLLGPVEDGEAGYDFVEPTTQIDPSLLEGLNQPFLDFVMAPNSERAGDKSLLKPINWDEKFLAYVQRSVTIHARARNYWRRLESIEQDYAYVVQELEEVGLPVVLAGIPYQESHYTSDAQSVACAKGYWQLMPEVARRVGVEVRDCKLRGQQALWSPSRDIAVRGVMKNAPYIDHANQVCKISKTRGCAVDERIDLAASTRGAIELLADAWNHDVVAESGAAVQITILSHPVGFDDSRYEERKYRSLNVLPSYQRHLEKTNQSSAPDFYGENILCEGKDTQGVENFNSRCGGLLANHGQHYAYNAVAQHFLAVCYYGKNYGETAPFNKWRDYVRGDGYCTRIAVPERDALTGKGGLK